MAGSKRSKTNRNMHPVECPRCGTNASPLCRTEVLGNQDEIKAWIYKHYCGFELLIINNQETDVEKKMPTKAKYVNVIVTVELMIGLPEDADAQEAKPEAERLVQEALRKGSPQWMMVHPHSARAIAEQISDR